MTKAEEWAIKCLELAEDLIHLYIYNPETVEIAADAQQLVRLARRHFEGMAPIVGEKQLRKMFEIALDKWEEDLARRWVDEGYGK